eukprot:COSAG01_NODE_856_length_13082_cov_23.882009_6_plen_325_part_00
MSGGFWNCICQPAQAKYAIDELLRQVRLASHVAANVVAPAVGSCRTLPLLTLRCSVSQLNRLADGQGAAEPSPAQPPPPPPPLPQQQLVMQPCPNGCMPAPRYTFAAGDGNGGDLTAPDRGLQVSPFMMFMLFMGFVYVALTLQQRATRQVQTSASPHYTRYFARAHAPRRPSAYLCGSWARLRTELTRTASRTERPREGLAGAVEAPRPLRLSTELASPAFVFLCLIILNMFQRVRQPLAPLSRLAGCISVPQNAMGSCRALQPPYIRSVSSPCNAVRASGSSVCRAPPHSTPHIALRIKHALLQKLGLRSGRASNHHGSSTC